MDGHCEKHVFEATEGLCRSCGGEFCGDCLVYAYGHKKPPYCVSCALTAAGVRSTAARHKVRSRREMKREFKEQQRAAKLATKASGTATSDLFEATTIPVSGPSAEFEFTISDDGTVERPSTDDIPPPPPAAATVRSIFDYTEEPVG